MSFLKIRDPLKREETVKEFVELKKRIRDNQLAERTGDIDLQTDLSKFFKPITETQKVATKEITKELGGIKKMTDFLPQLLMLQKMKPKESKEPLTLIEDEPLIHSSQLFTDEDKLYLRILEEEGDNYDETFGVKKIGDNYWLGDKTFSVNFDEEVIYVGKKPFPLTNELITIINLKEIKMLKDLDSIDYSPFKKDFKTYQEIMKFSNAIYKNNDPTSKKHKGDGKGKKWKLLLEPVWDEISKKNKPPFIKSPFKSTKYSLRSRSAKNESSNNSSGKGLRKNKKTTIVIPSDPNALLERLDLLMASKGAGNTGVRNELVSICDELKRQRVFNTKTYKKLMSILKK